MRNGPDEWAASWQRMVRQAGVEVGHGMTTAYTSLCYVSLTRSMDVIPLPYIDIQVSPRVPLDHRAGMAKLYGSTTP